MDIYSVESGLHIADMKTDEATFFGIQKESVFCMCVFGQQFSTKRNSRIRLNF